MQELNEKLIGIYYFHHRAYETYINHRYSQKGWFRNDEDDQFLQNEAMIPAYLQTKPLDDPELPRLPIEQARNLLIQDVSLLVTTTPMNRMQSSDPRGQFGGKHSRQPSVGTSRNHDTKVGPHALYNTAKSLSHKAEVVKADIGRLEGKMQVLEDLIRKVMVAAKLTKIEDKDGSFDSQALKSEATPKERHLGYHTGVKNQEISSKDINKKPSSEAFLPKVQNYRSNSKKFTLQSKEKEPFMEVLGAGDLSIPSENKVTEENSQKFRIKAGLLAFNRTLPGPPHPYFELKTEPTNPVLRIRESIHQLEKLDMPQGDQSNRDGPQPPQTEEMRPTGKTLEVSKEFLPLNHNGQGIDNSHAFGKLDVNDLKVQDLTEHPHKDAPQGGFSNFLERLKSKNQGEDYPKFLSKLQEDGNR